MIGKYRAVEGYVDYADSCFSEIIRKKVRQTGYFMIAAALVFGTAQGGGRFFWCGNRIFCMNSLDKMYGVI